MGYSDDLTKKEAERLMSPPRKAHAVVVVPTFGGQPASAEEPLSEKSDEVIGIGLRHVSEWLRSVPIGGVRLADVIDAKPSDPKP